MKIDLRNRTREPALWTIGTQLVWLALLLGLAGCNIPGMEPPPSENVPSLNESVNQLNTPEFADGPLQRQARLSIPAGALDGAIEARFGIGVSTSSSPFPAVDFRIGRPVDEMLTIDEPGNKGKNFPWPLPDACSGGCDVVIPVTIEQTGTGATPSFSWSASFYVEFDQTVPEAADRMKTVIEPADPNQNS